MKKHFRFAAMSVITITGFALGLPGVAQGAVIARYSFDANYDDSSGNGNDGVAFDGNGDGDTDGVSITTTAGEFKFGGGAADFGAERDYVDIPTQSFGSGSEYTVSFWAKRTGTSSRDMVIGLPDHAGFFIELTDFDTLRWRSSNSTTPRQADFAATNDTAWRHYVIVAEDADGDSTVDDITFYRDGAFVGTDNDNATGFIFDAIGEAYTSAGNLDMDGQIDEVWIFDEAIDAATVSNLFNSNALVPEPSSFLLLGIASIGLISARRRRNR